MMLAVVLMSHDNLKHPTRVLLAHFQLMRDTLDGKPKEFLSLALLQQKQKANIHSE